MKIKIIILGCQLLACIAQAQFPENGDPLFVHDALGEPIDYSLPSEWIRAEDPLDDYFRDQFRALMPEEEDLTVLDKNISSNNWLGQLDFTGVSVGARKATAIHERLVVMANHYSLPVGSVVTWVDGNNIAHRRTLVGLKHLVSNDQTLGILDKPLPASIKKYKVLPYGFRWLEALRDSWMLIVDQERKALGFSYRAGSVAWQFGAVYYNTYFFDNLTEEFPGEERSPPAILWELLIEGDSGGPGFVIHNGQLTLLTINWYTNGGAHITTSPWLLNSALDLLEDHLIPIEASQLIEENDITVFFEHQGDYYNHIVKASYDLTNWFHVEQSMNVVNNLVEISINTTDSRMFFKINTSIKR